MDETTLTSAFLKAFSVGRDGLSTETQTLLDFCHEDGRFVVDDLPYPLDKAGFADHCLFHEEGLWDRRTLAIISLQTQLHETTQGKSGLVHGTYNMRGKPRNAGFRQRPGHFSAVCIWDADAQCWKALNLHFSPLFSQVLDASPS